MQASLIDVLNPKIYSHTDVRVDSEIEYNIHFHFMSSCLFALKLHKVAI